MTNSFVNAVINQESRTENGMKARSSTTNAVVDLFFKIGASRGKNIIPDFVAALVEDNELAVRIALWARDVTNGAGEREVFRQVLKYLETNRPDLLERILPKVSELGRFDDYFVFETLQFQEKAFEIVGDAILKGNGLAAKWTPREKALSKFKPKDMTKETFNALTFEQKLNLLNPSQKRKWLTARKFREYLGLSEKQFRNLLVKATKVVETQMCKNDWDEINFSHVPSLASARYKKAFNRHTPKYGEYVASLVKGDNPEVKVNAGAVYPYDVLKGVMPLSYWDSPKFDKTEKDLIIKQWEALPNYVGNASILPLVDVSGSMSCLAGSKGSTSCLQVAVSLGLYLAEKNLGKFKDTFLTFSSFPKLVHLKGNIIEKCEQMKTSKWEMNTCLHSAFDTILNVAVKGNVSQDEMPKMLLILSDMQFDQCTRYDDSAIEMIQRKYKKAGYEMPLVVFWNINAYDNVPVKSNENGVALVSGFSPSIVKAVLSADMEQFTPEGIMMKTIMNSRYDF